jgi:hypothetical protein
MTLISVRPADLRAAGQDLGDSAQLIAQSYQSREPDLSVAHHAGWLTQAELVSAATAWTTYLRGLHEAVEGKASALRAAAESYAASERDAAALQRNGGFPW